MEVVIREARIGDAAAIARLSREELGYDYPLEQLREKLESLLARPEHKIFVAEAGGGVAGYLHLADYEVLYARPMKNILGIAVAAAYRRQGVGSLLLDAGERWAAESGAECVRLVSGEGRAGAHEFYRSRGYEFHKKQLNFSKELGGARREKEENQ